MTDCETNYVWCRNRKSENSGGLVKKEHELMTPEDEGKYLTFGKIICRLKSR